LSTYQRKNMLLIAYILSGSRILSCCDKFWVVSKYWRLL